MQGRAGVGWRRDAPAFLGARGRFTRPNDERVGPAPPDGGLDLPSSAPFQPVAARSDGFATDKMALYTHYPRHGVTLLELMITVTAISILAAMAYPSYREFMDRAGRHEAKALLLEIATNQDRYYLTARRFGSLAELGYSDPFTSDSGDYILSVPVRSATGFVATAQYNGSGAERVRCASLSINNLGERSSRGTLTDCWSGRR